MNKTFFGITALFALLGAPALAADLPLKAPPPPPIPSWTGFYVGANVGYGWANPNTDVASDGNFVSFVPLPINDAFPAARAGPLGTIPFSTNFAFTDTGKARVDGIVGGLQFGYNYQVNPNWLVGFEADIQGSGQRGSGLFADSFAGQFCSAVDFLGNCISFTPYSGLALISYDAKIDWFGTVRGRLGYLPNDRLLIYVTGGLAYGEVGLQGVANISASPVALGPSLAAFSAFKTNVGFAVGGGVEGKFFPVLPSNWTWKVEYLYLDLGSIDVAAPFVLTPAGAFITSTTGTFNLHSSRFTDNIVRVGLNYNFSASHP